MCKYYIKVYHPYRVHVTVEVATAAQAASNNHRVVDAFDLACVTMKGRQSNLNSLLSDSIQYTNAMWLQQMYKYIGVALGLHCIVR